MNTPATTQHRGRRVVAWVLGVFLLVLIAIAVWTGVRGALAASDLTRTHAALTVAAEHITDPDAAAASLEDAAVHAASAHALTSDPVWHLAETFPWIGPQLHAVGALAEAADDVAGSALAPLSEIAGQVDLDAFRLTSDGVDLSVFTGLSEAAHTATTGLRNATGALDDVETRALLAPVRAQFDNAAAQLAAGAEAGGALARATTLLPSMLGADEPRQWLLLFQNNAELRSLGGMPGATAIVTADNGQISLTDQGTAGMNRFDSPVLDLDPTVHALYGNRPAVWFSGTTLIPDFATAAPLAREMWAQEHGVTADGVIAIDPIALSYLLEATGPVEIPGGHVLTADTAVNFLLNEVYLLYPDPTEQNAVFALAAASVFEKLTAGEVSPAALVAALARAGDERRLLLWSSDADEQALLAETTLSGPLPASDSDTTRFGVYLNDGTGSKLGYYLDVDPTVTWDACPAHGAPGAATLTLDLANTAPLDAPTSLPGAIAGGSYGVPKGTLRVVTFVYLPEGSMLLGADATGSAGFGGGTHDGFQVLQYAVDLAPGESSSAQIQVRVDGTPSEVEAWVTPAFGESTVVAGCGI